MKEVAKKKEAAEKIKQQVQVVKDRAQAIVDIIEKDKALAEIKLEAAKPALLVLNIAYFLMKKKIYLHNSQWNFFNMLYYNTKNKNYKIKFF